MIRPKLPGPPGLRYRLFLAGYGAFLAVAEPLIWRYFRKRAEKDARYGENLAERQGQGARFQADIWVHAVSLGEMTSAAPLVRLCLDAGYSVVTTHATPAGRAAAETAFGPDIAAGRMAVRYAPVDRKTYWRRFFAATTPRVGLVMEMEFWPVMLEAASASGVILCLANSQVPSKSYGRASRVARLVGHPVTRAAAVFAKSGRMAERFRALGARHVEAMGETRFDMAVPEAQLAAGRALSVQLAGRPVLTLASVVAGEERTYLEEAVRPLLAVSPKPLVIWVPRAPELFAQTIVDLRAEGLSVAARSEAFDDELKPRIDLSDVEILVGDSMGEMFFYMAPADAVLVGGGFLESGAHNVIEPLALGKPVITGPNVWTIEYPATEAREAGVLTICESPSELISVIRGAMAGGGPAASTFHAANSGASRRIFDAIAPLLE